MYNIGPVIDKLEAKVTRQNLREQIWHETAKKYLKKQCTLWELESALYSFHSATNNRTIYQRNPKP